MGEYKGEMDQDYSHVFLQAFRINRRIGFNKARIGIFYTMKDGLGEKDGPGYSIDLYDEDNSQIDINLFSLTEQEYRSINWQKKARILAKEIMGKTGLDIKIIDKIQGHRLEYDKHDEHMWIAKMAMQGIDDDY